MRYTNKNVLAIRDHANALLKEGGNDDELFLTVSQGMFKIWNRNGKVETELVGHSTNDETYRWFEGFNVGMKCNYVKPRFDAVSTPVGSLNKNKTTIMSKVLNYFNQF